MLGLASSVEILLFIVVLLYSLVTSPQEVISSSHQTQLFSCCCPWTHCPCPYPLYIWYFAQSIIFYPAIIVVQLTRKAFATNRSLPILTSCTSVTFISIPLSYLLSWKYSYHLELLLLLNLKNLHISYFHYTLQFFHFSALIFPLLFFDLIETFDHVTFEFILFNPLRSPYP